MNAWIWLIPVLAGVFALPRLAPGPLAKLAFALDRRLSGLTAKRQDIAGFSMPYLDGGTGETLVLIHGFGADKDHFTRLARWLTPHFRVVIPDLPGFGEASRDPAARYRMEDQILRLQAFLQALGITRMILGGNSMGGFIATLYAARHASEVRALWLLEPAGASASNDTAMLRRYAETGDIPLLAQGENPARRAIEATMARPPYFPGFVTASLLARAIADLELHTAILKDLFVHSPMLETEFTTLATPALIVWGTEDKVLNPKGARAMQALLPASTVSLMPGIGHLPMIEAPAETASRFLGWIKTLR